jgi:mannose-6-phosphate isomerase-like protein (cupin superfamily)
VRGVREGSGDVGYEGEREDVEDDTVVVPTRHVTLYISFHFVDLVLHSTCIYMATLRT